MRTFFIEKRKLLIQMSFLLRKIGNFHLVFLIIDYFALVLGNFPLLFHFDYLRLKRKEISFRGHFIIKFSRSFRYFCWFWLSFPVRAFFFWQVKMEAPRITLRDFRPQFSDSFEWIATFNWGNVRFPFSLFCIFLFCTISNQKHRDSFTLNGFCCCR